MFCLPRSVLLGPSSHEQHALRFKLVCLVDDGSHTINLPELDPANPAIIAMMGIPLSTCSHASVKRMHCIPIECMGMTIVWETIRNVPDLDFLTLQSDWTLTDDNLESRWVERTWEGRQGLGQFDSCARIEWAMLARHLRGRFESALGRAVGGCQACRALRHSQQPADCSWCTYTSSHQVNHFSFATSCKWKCRCLHKSFLESTRWQQSSVTWQSSSQRMRQRQAWVP